MANKLTSKPLYIFERGNQTLDYHIAHNAAVKALAGHGITPIIAEGIVSQMEHLQYDEWTRTLERVAAGESKHVRLFVAWDDVKSFRTFIYSGDKDSTVAAMFRAWGERQLVDQVSVGAWGDKDVNADSFAVELGETEVVPVACFDLGRGLSDALYTKTTDASA
jgi:hypothetical protein